MRCRRQRRRRWTAADLKRLRRFYPVLSPRKLECLFNRTVSSLYGTAKKLGVSKSAEYLASPEACRLRRGDNVGAPFRFPPGHVPANKGLRRPGWFRGPVAARPGECPLPLFRALHGAWRQARRRKTPSLNQLSFESRWLDGLMDLEDRISAGTWQPSPTTCFIARRPKAREIHAPDFADRVVHHWLVPQLEALYERTFVHDSFSNQKGKGTHTAVDRLQAFVRQVESGQGGGWYLQLDVRNFFNTIHRPTLWRILKRRMARAGLPLLAQRVAHQLLARSALSHGVHHASTAAERSLVPPHKRLEASAPGRGLPIGNLSSQFLANVYLNELDQYVKHVLKVPRYIRYVDDLVIVHHDRAQLQAWHSSIDRFLEDRLRLQLKPDFKLEPLNTGIDFLGYIVYPQYRLIRERVIHHAIEALQAWQRAHVRGSQVRATPAAYREVRSVWHSYLGHFRHGRHFTLAQRIRDRFPWLRSIAETDRSFDYRLEGRHVEIEVAL